MSTSELNSQHLEKQVSILLDLFSQEPSLRTQQDTTQIETSLKKALSPEFEIVFAGAFSAGKSMLINALLEQELLYSAEGHATGTECYIRYAEPTEERVVLTFLSGREIEEQVEMLSQRLSISSNSTVNQEDGFLSLQNTCKAILEQEGGESKSERAKAAKGLSLLLEGLLENLPKIDSVRNSTYSMEQFNFSNLTEAAKYARRGSNSAVLKRLEYYCHHELLKDGNVLVDMPGIDAPVKKDALLTFNKIEDPETSAVVCILKPASVGEMSNEETSLLERISSNPSIRDRVFYVFNRIDQTWYNAQLRQRLDRLLQTEFNPNSKIYKTSGLLGFYGSQIKKHTSIKDRFGLDSIFAGSVKGSDSKEETPQFVNEFNNYCANSNKLNRTNFRVVVNSWNSSNENYVRILSEWGTPLIEQLIADSGIIEFRQAIVCYLTQEKKPLLFAALANDLQPLCIKLQKYYQESGRELESQPRELEAMKQHELQRIYQELQKVTTDFKEDLEKKVNEIVTNCDPLFESDFEKLKAKMIVSLDDLLQKFSVTDAYKSSVDNHPRNSTAPFLAVLVEALYSISNKLEDVLIEYTEVVVTNCCARLLENIRQAEYYRHLYSLLGEDGGIEQSIKELEENLIDILKASAKKECDRYVRESPMFYDEGTFSIYQFRQTLEQTSQGYDCQSIVYAEPAIRELLKLDFEPKVSRTIRRDFRQTINQTLKTKLIEKVEKQGESILQKYDQARQYKEATLEKEAQEIIDRNQRLQVEIEQKIELYNQAILEINTCLNSVGVYDSTLPLVIQPELQAKPLALE